MSKLPEIRARVIAHKDQRYETVGDYHMVGRHWAFRVSAMGDWRYEFLVLLHELVEWAWCRQYGIDNATIDDFDFKFEADRKKGLHSDDEEAGDDPAAPYYEGHQFATKLERLAAAILKVKWERYDRTVMSL